MPEDGASGYAQGDGDALHPCTFKGRPERISCRQFNSEKCFQPIFVDVERHLFASLLSEAGFRLGEAFRRTLEGSRVFGAFKFGAGSLDGKLQFLSDQPPELTTDTRFGSMTGLVIRQRQFAVATDQAVGNRLVYKRRSESSSKLSITTKTVVAWLNPLVEQCLLQ